MSNPTHSAPTLLQPTTHLAAAFLAGASPLTDYESSLIGRVLRALASHPMLACVVCAAWRIISEDTLHRLSEFPAYTPAPTHDHDEPLFTRGRWKRVVEHKTFGVGTPLHRKTLNNGTAVVVVQYGDIERSLAIDAAYWVTPIEVLLSIRLLKETFPKKIPATPSKMDAVRQMFCRCSECGKEFANEKGQTIRQAFEFCGETPITGGDCKKAWLSKHESASDLLKQEVRLHRVTPGDVDWAERQTAFEHSLTMPRKAANFCPGPVGLGGVYVQQNGEPRPLSLRELERGEYEERLFRKVAEFRACDVKEFDEWIKFRHTHPGKYIWNPNETAFFQKHIGSPSEKRDINEFLGLVRLGVFSDEQLQNGGRRVNTAGMPEDASYDHGSTSLEKDRYAHRTPGDSCSRDDQGEKIFNTKQPWEQVPPTVSVCEWPRCGKSFAARKGTKYCLGGNCRKRHHEEQGQANNLPNSQEAA